MARRKAARAGKGSRCAAPSCYIRATRNGSDADLPGGRKSMKPRKSMIGLAAAMLLVFAAAPAHAGAGSVCKEKTATSVDNKGSDGSECFASSDGSSTAKSKATGDKSFADAEVSTGGRSKAAATGGSFSEAISDTGGHSTSNSSSGSDGDATSDDHGVAKTTATESSEAHSLAFGKCDAVANSTGGSLAVADCEADGTFAHATATGGGTAKGFYNASPVCTPGAGTARVRSSGGNCG